MGGSRGSGEVRFPRPQDPDRDRDGAKAHRPTGDRDRSGQASSRRCGNLRAAPEGRHGRRVPARRSGHARCVAEAQARPLRGHHRHRRALPPGADGQHRFLCEPQARTRGVRGAPRDDRAHPSGDLRGHHLPGAGDADCAGPLRLLARRGGFVAPRHGQENQEGDGGAEVALRRGRGRKRRGPRARRVYFRTGGEVRGLWLQQVPRRGLCLDRLPDRLSQGQLPDRVPGGVDDPRHGQCRQAERFRARGAAPRHTHRTAIDQSLGGGLYPKRRRHPLFAGGAEECGTPRGGAYRRRAGGAGTLPRRVRLRPAHQSASRQQACLGDPRRRGRPR